MDNNNNYSKDCDQKHTGLSAAVVSIFGHRQAVLITDHTGGTDLNTLTATQAVVAYWPRAAIYIISYHIISETQNVLSKIAKSF